MYCTRTILIGLAALLMAADTPAAATIYDLVATGRLDEARDSLSRTASAASRDGDLLFFQALLETNATDAARLLEASMTAAVSAEYREEVIYRLAQYYHAAERDLDLARIVNQYRTEYERGRFDGEMRRLAIISDERSGRRESALRQLDKYLVRFGNQESSQWATIDKARVMIASDRRHGAVELLRSLSRKRTGPGAAQALYLLTLDSFRSHRYDDAVFYYNLLREAYPRAVGLDVLIDKLGSISEGSGGDDRAEQLTGTYYSVKVGVFSQRDNARRQKETFKRYDKPVEIMNKNISGKKYYAVYIGRFSSYDAAAQFKSRLEASHNEVFQVVTR